MILFPITNLKIQNSSFHNMQEVYAISFDRNGHRPFDSSGRKLYITWQEVGSVVRDGKRIKTYDIIDEKGVVYKWADEQKLWRFIETVSQGNCGQFDMMKRPSPGEDGERADRIRRFQDGDRRDSPKGGIETYV